MTKHQSFQVAVLGSGSWGTALASVLARNGHEVRLWGRDPEDVLAINKHHENTRYLQDISLPKSLRGYTDLAAAIHCCDYVLIVVPSNAFSEVIDAIRPMVPANVPIIWATKGLQPKTGLLLDNIVCENFSAQQPRAVLSGPSFAKEVALAMPTAVTLACHDANLAKDLQQLFHDTTFRVYTSDDLVGVQVAGAVKNVLAIATGIADGLGFGANARAALITRGLAEMTRLGVALGGQMETFMGLAGVGDLVLTCTDNQSRNRRFGLALGEGLTAEQAQQRVVQVVEGRSNAADVMALANAHQVEMPIVEQVYQVLYQGVKAKQAVKNLLTRSPKSE